ncbi:PREDICTED: xanthine dehydrogenase/oxidase-like [Trachymyrmex cornetzi]|uniref:xanthine dehydrogenase/oxidase-like n=1 Tax=Trachymyrmex cornetzi TaxID=471704 RepID=UPI00084F69EE|nr:PREDICTED: xanthine dehydrogenase/oxidase-like [Trachymyrmex cornetzi]
METAIGYKETITINKRDSRDYINFTINGVSHAVSGNGNNCRVCIPTSISLNIYIRHYAKLRGTKAMCHEGGCGTCIVAVKIKDKTMAVNSCLVPILICDGWNIYTIEGLGNKKDGYHTIQATLANKNGSQCGYCSPGMVMNLYGLIHDKKLSMEQIENSFGGNICRCTGYRSILDAFKGFANDAPQSLVKNISDIEELYKIKTCPKYGMPRTDSGCDKQLFRGNILYMKLEDAEFYKVYTIRDVFGIFQRNSQATYILNGGNTAQGVYRSSKKDIYIDINDISELRNIQITKDYLVLGGNVTITMAIQTLQKYSTEPKFRYLRQLAEHVEKIANVPVRNIGSIAGNLMIKHAHNEFPSDMFLVLETVGAQIHILESPSRKQSVQLIDFLKLDMRHKIIYSVVLPPLSNEYEFRSFKIMPRAQNAHAHVNAGFLFKLDGSGKVLEEPNIIYGGINKQFLHATKTEKQLVGKSILDDEVLKAALSTLHGELQPDHVLPDYSPKFRRILAEGLFYKFVLSIKPQIINPRLRSGGFLLERTLSSGTQDYDTNRDMWPVNKPIAKLEAIKQTSGEAQYCNDLPPFPREVFCAFVLTEIGNGKIESIDASKALKMKGVVAFFSAKDIPGKNLCVSAVSELLFLTEDELLFADNDVVYAGQPVGVIVAETHNGANEAAKLVKITYSECRKPVISIEDAIATQDETRIRQNASIPAKNKGKNTDRVINGVFQCGSQYHYTMETQSCVCVPVEDGMDVYPTSQWMDLIQVSIAQCLNVQNNSINVYVSRIGGAYGAKISRNAQISCACALVCYKLNRPARFVLTIESNMQSVGKRYSTRQEYEIGVDNDGVIQYLNSKHWSNCGSSFNESQSADVADSMQSGWYATDTWTFNGFDVRTDIPSNTYCRAPSNTEGVAMLENIMEHIARVMKKDPVEVRLSNMNDVDKPILETMIKDLSKSADYEIRKRAVEIFNTQNRWKKKGIATVLMKYVIYYAGQFNAMVSVCARDGSVCVTHGGIEIGQGINTKIAQMVAYKLGIDLKLISVKRSNNIITPNNVNTGGSITTQSCGYAAVQACNEILKRLEPIKKEMTNPTWKDLVFAAFKKDVDLCARYMVATGPTKDEMKPYIIYGVTTAEVEIDVLTGEHIIRRVDLMEDAGISLNPEIDVGQVEGAFVMGTGFWTSEDLVYDPKTGVLTNDRTWNYKPPGAKDIPEDFRVYLRKNSVNPFGMFGSKATGESPLCMSCVIPIVIRKALNSARADAGNTDEWYRMDGPCTTERILLTSLTNRDDMVL